MILVDSSIPMYLVGAPHPHKAHARRLLENAERYRVVLNTLRNGLPVESTFALSTASTDER